MKIRLLLLFLAAAFVSVSAPAETPATPASVAAVYVSENKSGETLELKADGSFLLKKGEQEVKGTFIIEGTDLVLKTEGRPDAKGKIDGDNLIDPGQNKWTKKK